MYPLIVEKITVRADRLVLDVRLAPGVPAYSTPALAAAARVARPHLPAHTCINDCGPTFGAVINHTSIAHLFEHLVIDYSAECAANPKRTFTGTTEWTDRKQGRARVQVSMESDVAALKAVNAALDCLEQLFNTNDIFA